MSWENPGVISAFRVNFIVAIKSVYNQLRTKINAWVLVDCLDTAFLYFVQRKSLQLGGPNQSQGLKKKIQKQELED